jgi:hypothetical protein
MDIKIYNISSERLDSFTKRHESLGNQVLLKKFIPRETVRCNTCKYFGSPECRNCEQLPSRYEMHISSAPLNRDVIADAIEQVERSINTIRGTIHTPDKLIKYFEQLKVYNEYAKSIQ